MYRDILYRGNCYDNNSGITIKRNVKMIITKQITFDVLAVFSRAL